MMNIYQFELTDISGKSVPLSKYRGKVLLIVNVASLCGFTPQYEGLQRLYQDYHEQGFEILGFPCDQFRHQEPGDESEIKQFCQSRYQVSFPLFSKLQVIGPDAAPLFQYLKDEARGFLWSRPIKWNFTKFLIGRDGNVVRRYAPFTRPAALRSAIERLL